MNKEVKVVFGGLGSPLENFGLANFIQVYINNKPYFRYESREHSTLLEEILKEFELPFDTDKKYSKSAFGEINIPKPKGKNYSLVGEGQINEGHLVKKEDVSELRTQDYYAIFSSESDYGLYPSISHLNKILPYFDKQIIFASQEYQTEEQKGFLDWDPYREDDQFSEDYSFF